jgi:hypothetical protein
MLNVDVYPRPTTRQEVLIVAEQIWRDQPQLQGHTP